MSRIASTTVGVIIGGTVGAVTALLFAPKRGEEIRSDVKNWAVDAEQKAAARVRTMGSEVASGIRSVPKVVSEKAPVVVSKVKDVVSRTSERAAGQVDETSQGAAESMDRAAGQMSEM